MNKEANRPPDQRPLSAFQAERLSKVVKLEPDVLKELTYLEVTDKFKWHYEWPWLNHHKICGRVVKKDPVTGEELPVPFATVHVQDTDSSWITYAPFGSDWLWHFPIKQHRDTIATTRTDECGNFCVWVPWYTIEWIRTWHREIICDPFIRPSIKDYLPPIELEKPKWPPRVGPSPDPEPNWKKVLGLPTASAESFFGKQLMSRLVSGQVPDKLLQKQLTEQIETRVFSSELKPTLPEEFQMILEHEDQNVGLEAIHAALNLHTGLDLEHLVKFDPNKAIGPFWRCREVVFPIWQPHFDVPDITFEVLQDTNGDGVEEVVYHEGYFDVRWDAGALPNVKLVAGPQAVASRVCGIPPAVACNDIPEIQHVGFMPLDNPNLVPGGPNIIGTYVDGNGHAKRPNRPKPAGGSRPDAEAPFTGTLQLYGCVNVLNAVYYKVEYSLDGGPFTPFKGLTWPVYPGGIPVTVASDSEGWYLVQNTAAFPKDQLLEWPTSSNGKYVLKVIVADGFKNKLAESASVVLQIDNRAPAINFTKIAWKKATDASSAPFNDLDFSHCATIERGVMPFDILLKVECQILGDHYRDAFLTVGGCGNGNFAQINLASTLPTHWHESVGQHGITLTGEYLLPSGASEGSYSVGCTAFSRAFNPAGADIGPSVVPAWFYDLPNPYIYAGVSYNISVINR
jgi:hypothetical protein